MAILSAIWQWFSANFDKLLLTGLFGVLCYLVFRMTYDKLDVAQITWAKEHSDLVLGALLGLITGKALSVHPPEAK